MIVSPPKLVRDRPYALVTPGHRRVVIDTELRTYRTHGAERSAQLLEDFADHVLYTDASLTQMRHTTGARAWTADTWRSRATRMHLTGTKVSITPLRGALVSSTDPFSDLKLVMDWLRSHNVMPGAMSTMAWNLWRGTLSKPVVIDAPPKIGKAAMYGGRKQIKDARTYSEMVAVDIEAAYPTAMASQPYALSLERVGLSTRLDPDTPGVCAARVRVPELPFAPLPVRVADDIIQFQWGTIRGVWPWCDLSLAAALGCEVTPLAVWAPAKREVDLFGEWWQLVAEGRALPTTAAVRLAKQLANALWGTFAMDGGDRALVSWSDDQGDQNYTVRRNERRLPHVRTAHIAAETSARVRTRLHAEGLYGIGHNAVYIDTDGYIVRRSAVTRTSVPPGWRIKQRMRKVEIRAPQCYRYQCGKGCGVKHARWHHVVSGVDPTDAARLFERRGSGEYASRSALADVDIVLPPGHAAEAAPRLEEIAKARAEQAMVYGPGLGD
jgi:hypothetical protein